MHLAVWHILFTCLSESPFTVLTCRFRPHEMKKENKSIYICWKTLDLLFFIPPWWLAEKICGRLVSKSECNRPNWEAISKQRQRSHCWERAAPQRLWPGTFIFCIDNFSVFSHYLRGIRWCSRGAQLLFLNFTPCCHCMNKSKFQTMKLRFWTVPWPHVLHTTSVLLLMFHRFTATVPSVPLQQEMHRIKAVRCHFIQPLQEDWLMIW